MKNYLQNRNNNHMEHTSLFDALDDFFRPVFADEADYLKSNISETDRPNRSMAVYPLFRPRNLKNDFKFKRLLMIYLLFRLVIHFLHCSPDSHLPLSSSGM